MELVSEWAPNIHPLLVHFPIAILILAAGINLLTFFIPEKWWDEQKSTILYTIGAIAIIVVYYTGKSAADSVFLPTEAQSVLTNHADWAFWTVWFFILYAVLRLALHWFQLMERKGMQILAFLIVLPGLFLLYETGDHGAKMVFGYGVGTGQLLEEQQDTTNTITEAPVEADSLSVEYSFTGEGENWSWQMGPNSIGELIYNFQWLDGSVRNLNPKIIQRTSETYLELTPNQDPNFFVTHQTYQNVQVDYYMTVENFNGKVKLVHHAIDSQNYDFVALNQDGVITQGRVADGNESIFEKGTYDPSGQLFIRVVGDGTHFRGYVDEELIVHGHGDAPEAGGVGFRLDGEGTILISTIELTQLN